MREKTLKAVKYIKQLVGLHIIIPDAYQGRKKNKTAWKNYVIRTKKKKTDISGNLDKILYNHN